MTGDEEIERYLDELLVQLRGSPRAVRRVLAETEAHLRDAVADGVQADEAIRRFGAARMIATASNGVSGTPVAVLLRQVLLAVCLLSAIGCVAIGASGLISGAMDATFGPRFVAGDLPSITYTADRCAEYRLLAPQAATCGSAAARHHTDEVETFRISAGILGLIGFGVWSVLRRRWRATPATGALPAALVPGIGASVFCVATLAMASQGMQSLGWHSTAGIGQWLSAAAVSGVVALGFALALVRSLLHPAVTLVD